MSVVTDKLKELSNKKSGMDREYQQIEPVFREMQTAMEPTRGRFSVGEKRRSSGYNKRIIDTAAQRGLRTLVSGLMAGMTSPSRPWFKLGLYDRDAVEDYEVKQWLHTAQQRMYDVMRAGNTYRMFSNCYKDLGQFGIFGGLMRGDFENVMHTHSLPTGMFRIGEDENSSVDTMHYQARRSVKQLVDEFGIENVSNDVKRAYEKHQYFEMRTINHVIEPRKERDTSSKLATDMLMASYQWENGETKKFLRESGYGVNNILAPRWERIEGEAWPTSWPSLMALGDTIQLQNQHRDKAQAIQYSFKPPMLAPAGMTKRYRNIPGGVTTMNTVDLQKGGLRPAVEVRPDVNALSADINETRQRISSAYFEDLFLMTSQSDRRQVTATEIAERHEEKLLVLGPVLESLDHELLSKVIEGVFHYMQEADILPPAPDSISGTAVKVEYVSLLAQAQKAVGVAAIERTLGFAGSLAQIKPEALDNLDPDAMMREFTDQVGPPPNTLLPANEVTKIREARAQQQQQEQAIESAQPLAGAANLLSQANERSEAALQRGAPL